MKRWRVVRLQALDRDGWACTSCGRRGRLEVDHKTALEDGGDLYDLDNLQALCRSCHFSKSRREQQARHPRPDRDGWQTFIDERKLGGV